MWARLPGAILIIGISALASAEPAPSLIVTTYDVEDGLAHDRVFRIIRDAHGFLWFCTAEGLSRFDGQRFRTYGVAEGLPVAFVNDLLVTRDGTYWVATNGGGVAHFRPEVPLAQQRFSVLPVGTENVTAEVYRLREDAAGTVWAGTQGGLFRLEGRGGAARFVSFPLAVPGHPDRSVRVWALATTPQGDLWVGHNRGLTRVRPGRGIHHHAVQPTPAGDNVWDLLVDRGGRLWITHERTLTALRPGHPTPMGAPFPWWRLREGPATLREDGTVRLPEAEGEAVRYNMAHGLPSNAAGPIVETTGGAVWIGANRLSVFRGGRFESVRAAGLPESGVISLAEDHEGAVWVGTRARGAVRLKPSRLESRTLSERGGDELVTSFFEAAGAVYAVSGSGRMRRFDHAGGVTTIELPFPDRRAPVPDARPGALRSRAGEWWVGTPGGLVRVPAVEDTRIARVPPLGRITTREGLASDAIGVLHEDRAGDVWIGHSVPTDRPLARWNPGASSVRSYGSAEGLPPHNMVTAIAEDAAGRLFVGFHEGGVSRRDGERFTALPGLDPAVVGGIFDLLFDGSGRLWIATSRGGLLRVEDPAAAQPRVEALTDRDGLASSGVRAVVDDAWGRIYALSSRGVDCLDPVTLQRLRRLTTADGIANYYFHAAFRDSRGRLWFGTREGLTTLMPEPWKPRAPPRSLIDGLLVSGVRLPVADLGQARIGPLAFDHDQNTVHVEYFAVDYAAEPTRFRYRLDGADEAWSAPTVERAVHYGRLRPGSYRFRVKEVEAPDTLAAEVAFAILPPLWERTSFRLAVAIAVVALASLAYRARVARLLALERVRTRIAADLHDDIGSGLSRIALVSEVVKRDVEGTHAEAARRLDDVAQGARELIDATSDIVWSVDPRHDHLDDLAARLRAFGSDLLEPLGIAWRLEVDGDGARVRLGPEQRRHVYLLLKEALHNAARHSGARSVTLRLAASRRALTALLRDDGRGFAEGDGRPSRGGHGLGNMRQRAEALGGRLEIAGAPDGGTTIRLDVPLKNPAA